tara:strand:- start:2260 stop:2475 length:216 start_codon:yes stop_codon:yes gene_type:complete
MRNFVVFKQLPKSIAKGKGWKFDGQIQAKNQSHAIKVIQKSIDSGKRTKGTYIPVSSSTILYTKKYSKKKK